MDRGSAPRNASCVCGGAGGESAVFFVPPPPSCGLATMQDLWTRWTLELGLLIVGLVKEFGIPSSKAKQLAVKV